MSDPKQGVRSALTPQQVERLSASAVCWADDGCSFSVISDLVSGWLVDAHAAGHAAGQAAMRERAAHTAMMYDQRVASLIRALPISMPAPDGAKR